MSKLGLILLAVWSVYSHADDLDAITKRGSVVIGVRGDAPPLGQFDSQRGVVTGFDVDMATLVAKRLGVKAQFKTVTADDAVNALKQGRVDLLFAAMPKISEHDKNLEYSIGYFVTAQKLATRRGRLTDLKQLDHMVICVAAGSSGAQLVHQLTKVAKVLELPDEDAAFHNLRIGRCDATPSLEPIALGRLASFASHEDFEVADLPLEQDVLSAGVRHGEKRLVEQINEALVSVEQSGEAQQVFNRWFGPKTATPLIRTFKIQY
ncbi:MAG: transporter substrate-binding domain-containing protein [Burkholderiales bacterium]|nr:transporter substrate-binding domain-containing protein [Burkholderiales bacterium]